MQEDGACSPITANSDLSSCVASEGICVTKDSTRIEHEHSSFCQLIDLDLGGWEAGGVEGGVSLRQYYDSYFCSSTRVENGLPKGVSSIRREGRKGNLIDGSPRKRSSLRRLWNGMQVGGGHEPQAKPDR